MKNFRRHVRRRSADFGGVLVLVQMNGEAEVNQLKRSTRLRTETFGAVVRHTGDRRSGPCELGGTTGSGKRRKRDGVQVFPRLSEPSRVTWHRGVAKMQMNAPKLGKPRGVCVCVSAMRGAQRCVLYRLVFVKQVLRLEVTVQDTLAVDEIECGEDVDHGHRRITLVALARSNLVEELAACA